MKRIFTILITVLLSATLWAQSPEKMSYQAVIHNSSNGLVQNQSVGMRVSVLQGSADGTTVYVETQTPTSNANGLVTIEIGSGTSNDDFRAIDWSAGTYFIKTETDPTGGTNYSITGVSQLLSVPYALHAKTAETVTGTITENDPVFTNWDKNYSDLINKPIISDTIILMLDTTTQFVRTEIDGSTTNEIQTISISNDTIYLSNGGYVKLPASTPAHYVGELYGGGVVFWVDQTGEHGLIASTSDLDGGSGAAWSDIKSAEIGASAKDYYNGAGNTAAIIAQSGHTNSAAKLCNDYKGGNFTDWYLPSTLELRKMDNSILIINNVLANDGSGETNPIHPEFVAPTYGRYWSSTEYNIGYAWRYDFSHGQSVNGSSKDQTYRVRAVRAF